MKLVRASVRKFRNFVDSTPVEIQPDITCLVGKNESGKTAFAQALNLLNPARTNVQFSAPDQYPAWLEKKDRRAGQELEKFKPIEAVFKLEAADREPLEERFGQTALWSREVTVSRNYANKLSIGFDSNEKAALDYVLGGVTMPGAVKSQIEKAQTFEELAGTVDEFEADEAKTPETVQAAAAIKAAVEKVLGKGSFQNALESALKEKLPHFFYFANYSSLPYTVKIRELLTAKDKDLSDDLMTARCLLRMAGADQEYLLNPDYERRKRELENVANALTQDVLKYWTQNPDLRVQPDITQRTEQRPDGQHAVIDELKIRIWDQRHSLSLPFTEHSSGFQWFFSFLAAFSEYEHRATPVIILLDEPALGLHARAQADFLRFIEEKLAVGCQVIYTTHSPFMVQPGRLERVRIVEDRGPDAGAKVSQDVLGTDPDTLFPLQGALGYDLVQHLFIGPNNLIMEGTSDYTYLTVVSDFLKQQPGRQHLDERWSGVPVGGADSIPTFVALLGTRLEMTVLVDSRKVGHQRLTALASQGYLQRQRIITVGQILGRSTADIEDLFSEDDYLRLYNLAFGSSLGAADIPGSDPIVSRIARHLGVDRFDHGRPADLLLRKRDEQLPKLGESTLKNFESLFAAINATLPK